MTHEPITLNVTKRDIQLGWKCESESCPIARALLRCKGVSYAYVGRHRIDFKKNGKSLKAYLPPPAQNFIGNFDQGKIVKPIKFNVAVWE